MKQVFQILTNNSEKYENGKFFFCSKLSL